MSESDPRREQEQRPGGDAGGGGDGRPEDREPIPLEPSEPEPPRAPPGQARIESPGLLEDFDEDADFDSDPELERVVKGIPVEQQRKPATPAAEAPAEPMGRPLCPTRSWKTPAIIGAVVTITAAVFAGVYAADVAWAHVLLTIYRAAIHTATGVGAVFAAALLLGRGVGHYEGTAARMFMAVSFFLVVYSLRIPISGTRVEEIILGTAAYFGGVVVAFRLSVRDAAVIGGAHFGLALLIAMGNQLSGVIASAGAAQ